MATFRLQASSPHSQWANHWLQTATHKRKAKRERAPSTNEHQCAHWSPLTVNRSNWSNWLLLSSAAAEWREKRQMTWACWEAVLLAVLLIMLLIRAHNGAHKHTSLFWRCSLTLTFGKLTNLISWTMSSHSAVTVTEMTLSRVDRNESPFLHFQQQHNCKKIKMKLRVWIILISACAREWILDRLHNYESRFVLYYNCG